ncbi:hypothetical protein S40293_05813 [Stachybotrys chartarum IBT 40293]|nr:hypothetical protein S40293_05813 [Stachybotrys chartarum IBT 40293]
MAAVDIELPRLPAPHRELARYISEHPEQSIVDIMEPYRKYEAGLRAVFAQDRQNPMLKDPYVNVAPLFTEDTKFITTRARDLTAESEEEKSKYIMPLPDNKRRPHGSPATVADLDEFRKNFNVFSETSLVDLDWNNVVAAGSSVVNCLLPVPKGYDTTKRKLREYYHEKFCPASDVDLFLYGLTHEEAIEKIKQIEQAIRDALLNEVTVVRTKYALTIASQYPVRHVQIVLRVYKSISEILTGFDIDAAGGAYDGKQVWVTPRALGSFITQINHVDLTRRSPSYENRLSKYSHRDFEVYWPELDRSRIDPTIFERSFGRTLGLARLLVLERLPTSSARDQYLEKRRQERGRPSSKQARFVHRLGGNLKDYHEDEVADWLSDEDVSNYHTFTVPYGQKFNAKRIEKLCYTRDLLLNAEWNQSDKREVYLHRHPAFFGRVRDVIEDCCGGCPTPKTTEEIEVAQKEAEIYISGKVSFLIDDPGRQQIGSFNPLTEQDWTDMAYVGNTARLCQSIVDGDLEDVVNWLAQEGADPNKRDYTGRSPLHLAVMTSTPEVVRGLVEHGARLTARLADGQTALHLAASRGNTEMIKILMEKSIENEEAEEAKRDKRRKTLNCLEDNSSKASQLSTGDSTKTAHGDLAELKKPERNDVEDDESEAEIVNYEESQADDQSMATGSFVKVKKGEEGGSEDLVIEDLDDEPDYYQIDVLAWDVPCSPLHLAIAAGHEDVVKLLCDYGADSILPIKFLEGNSDETAAILTLTLALTLPREQAISMARLLLTLGATSAQADSKGFTAFHQYIEKGDMAAIDLLFANDQTGLKSAINHLLFTGYSWNLETVSPLHTAIERGDPILILKLLNAGAAAHIDFDTWLKAAKVSSLSANSLGTLEQNVKKYNESVEQPLIAAIRCGNPDVAIELLRNGADPNCVTSETQSLLTHEYQRRYTKGQSALDLVQHLISELTRYSGEDTSYPKPQELRHTETYLQKIPTGTYQHWVVSSDIQQKKERYEKDLKTYTEQKERIEKDVNSPTRFEAIKEAVTGLKSLEKLMKSKGAQVFEKLHPGITTTSGTVGSIEARDPSPRDYEFAFSFVGDGDMSETRRDGYIDLMNAAWLGQIEQIKSLTLQGWGSNQDQSPLKVTISDSDGNSPFSLAFLRGHHQVAQCILDIVAAQWSPRDEKLRYKMQSEERDDDEDTYNSEQDCRSDEDDHEPRIVSERIDKTFTIDNVGQVSMLVKSHIKPITIITNQYQTVKIKEGNFQADSGKRTLLQHALDMEDSTGLKFLLDMAQLFAAQKLPGDDDVEESGGNFTFPHDDFLWALQNGKTQLLGLIIKRTGAGIPLDHLVKKSGVEMKEKPRYYQGLTVYGKKRKDWATAGRNMVFKPTGLKTPPLLHAALGGNLEAVEFFLGDTPHRLYAEFGKSKAAKEDPRLKHLKESPTGFERTVSKWLGADNDLVIHCAVMANYNENGEEMLQYLVEACPEFIDKKSTDGDTPLMVACRLGRPKFAKILLDANADQSTRNLKGENIVHAALLAKPPASKLRVLLDLMDADLRSHLFLQRKSLHMNGTTPLHEWITLHRDAFGFPAPSRCGSRKSIQHQNSVATLKLLLEYSKGEELEMLNSAGDTCLHTAIMSSTVWDTLWIVKALIDFKPSLLLRENAVGRTPAEVAHDCLVNQQFSRPRGMRGVRNGYYGQEKSSLFIDSVVKAATAKGPVTTQTAEGLGLSQNYDAAALDKITVSLRMSDREGEEGVSRQSSPYVVWDLCHTALAKIEGKRRLVALNEANDVAKRLSARFTDPRYFNIQRRTDDGEEEEEEEEGGSEKKGEHKTTTDFAAGELSSRLGAAWVWPDDE